MSATIATLPRTGNGRMLFAGAAQFLRDLLASPLRTRAAPIQATAHAAAPEAVHAAAQSSVQPSPTLWQLYRLTVGYDAVSPKVAAELRRQLVG